MVCAAVDETADPRTLFGQKTAGLCIAHRVVNVNFAVTDIPVAANDEIRFLLLEIIDVALEKIHAFVFELLTDVARCSRRKIEAHHREIAVVGTQNTSFRIVNFTAATHFNVQWFFLRENGNAAVSFLLCRMPISVFVPRFRKQR